MQLTAAAVADVAHARKDAANECQDLRDKIKKNEKDNGKFQKKYNQ